MDVFVLPQRPNWIDTEACLSKELLELIHHSRETLLLMMVHDRQHGKIAIVMVHMCAL